MNDLRLPWHRETVGHKNVKKIAAKVAAELAVPLDEGIPANTDATWIINADGQVVAFVGNGPRQTDNADAIIAAVSRATPAASDGSLDVRRVVQAITNIAVRHGLTKEPPPYPPPLATIYGYSRATPDMDAEIAAEYARLSESASEGKTE